MEQGKAKGKKKGGKGVRRRKNRKRKIEGGRRGG